MRRPMSRGAEATSLAHRARGMRRIGLFGCVLLAALQSAIAPAAIAKDSLVVGVQLEPPGLDPSVNPAAAIAEMLDGNVYENLVRFRADGGVSPGLAESWDISSDGLVYTFELRQGVLFQDGTAFDASTAKFSLERARGPTNPQRQRIAAIESVEVLAPERLRIRLARRSGGLLESLALAAFVMVAPSSAAGNALRPIGTGPFRFEAWKRADSIVLVRNTAYWGRPAVMHRIVFRFIADPAAAYGALMAGDVDAFANYPAPESIAQFKADSRFRVLVGSSEGETLLGINNRRAPFDDLRVRRAIAHALDRRAIIDGAMFGFGTPIGSHFPPTNPAYVDLTGRYPHDVGEARALLAAAGYPHGFDATLKLPPPAYARRSGEIIASQLARVGIRVTLVNLEWAQWLDQVFARHDFDLSIVAHAEPLDYDIYGRDDYYFGYSSPAFKALLARLDDTVDATERRALLGDIQLRLADDAVNGFLFQYPTLAVWNSHVHHLRIDDPQGAIDVTHADDDATDNGVADSGVADSGVADRGVADRGVAAQGVRRAQGSVGRVIAGLGALGTGLLLLAVARRRGLPYLAGRVGMLAVTLLAASVIVFVLVEIVPGDPARYMLGLRADPTVLEALRRELGLDQPFAQRYATWVLEALRGDFGVSYTYRIAVGELIRERLEISVPLALFAMTLTVLIAFPAGLWSAARRGRPADALLLAATQLGLAVPNFWLGLVLVLVFAIDLHWVSAGGFPGWSAGVLPGLGALCLPAVALAAPQAAVLARVLRGALIDALSEDYVRTARAQGAGRWRVLYRHALPNALIPVLTILGLQFSFLLAGGVIIENVFFLPGLGRLVFQAITQRDLIVVQGVVMVLVFAVVMVSFLVDLAYVLVNPRLGSSGAAGALRP
jgi:ABC-type dipeptide/oligopeptide/nickel transport system permease component/ABC-type transport system substrate-binding protein